MKLDKGFFQLTTAILAITLFACIFTWDAQKNSDGGLEEALLTCLRDIENECKGVIGYALTLEQENARLNKAINECKSESR